MTHDIARLRTLNTAIVCDALDRMGVPPRVLNHAIRPSYAGATVAGTALPILQAPVARRPEEPYKLLFEAFEEILFLDGSGLGVERRQCVRYLGRVAQCPARTRGAVGAVLDGLTRDVEGIEAMGFPVFARGETPLDSEGRCEVFEYNTPILCGGARVEPHDVILADRAGVVVFPPDALSEVVARGEEKLNGENEVRGYLARGDSIREVFDTYGIL